MIKIGIILCAILAIVSFGHAKRTRSTRQKIVPAYFQAIANNQAKISSSFQQSDANSKSAKIQTLTTGTTPEGHYFEEEEIIEQLSPENFAPSNVFEYPVPELHATRYTTSLIGGFAGGLIGGAIGGFLSGGGGYYPSYPIAPAYAYPGLIPAAYPIGGGFYPAGGYYPGRGLAGAGAGAASNANAQSGTFHIGPGGISGSFSNANANSNAVGGGLGGLGGARANAHAAAQSNSLGFGGFGGSQASANAEANSFGGGGIPFFG